MQIPIISGIYTDEDSDFRTSYPRNMIPVPKETGISNGYLRPADGIETFGDGGPGVDRGGINWNGVCYRVMGIRLVSIDANGVVTQISGNIIGTDQVTMGYSFDYLAIAGGGNLYLYDGTTLTQVTDVNLGTCVDFIWLDGYFVSTDGESMVVTELGDPFTINPLKYGSSEVDPDPILAVLETRNELYALNRYTIEVFDNVGGTLFPFARIDGAQIQRGTIGTHACCVFLESMAFIGGALNETPAVWLGINGNTTKLSTREIDQILLGYSESVLADVLLESRIGLGHRQLYIHLPDKTLVYDAAASSIIGKPVWFILTSGVNTPGQYRAKNLIWCYNKFIVGDPASHNLGILTDNISSHYGEVNEWEFGTTIIYNETKGAIFHEIELVCLSGRSALGEGSVIWTQYSLDGVVWSQLKSIAAGKQGERNKRLVWFQQGSMKLFRTQRFKGTSESHLAVSLLDARIEGLAF